MYYSDSRYKSLYDWAEEHNLYLFRNKDNLDEVLKVTSFEARSSKRDLEYIPEEFEVLKNIHKIYIYYVGLKSLPQSIGKLKDLFNLTCVYNKLSELPKSILQCRHLQYLDLHINSIKKLPEELGNLKELHSLDVSANLIERLPLTLFKLKELEYLNISDNPISELPEGLRNCSNLRELDIRGTLITHIPEWLSELKHLKDFKYGPSTYQRFQRGDNNNPIQPIVEIDNITTFKLNFEKELESDEYEAMKITYRKIMGIDLLDEGIKVKEATMIGDEEWPLGTYIWKSDFKKGEYLEYYLKSRWGDRHGKIYKNGVHESLQALWEIGPINDEYFKLYNELKKKRLIR